VSKIRQIIPGSGWVSVRKEDDGRLFRQAIVCWALVEEEEDGEVCTYVVPMEADITGITEPLGPDEIVYKEAEGYVHPAEIPKHVLKLL